MNKEYNLLHKKVHAIATLSRHGVKGWYLDNIYVGEAFRYQGYGGELLRIVTDAADLEGAKLYLTVCAGNGLTNKQLINWYQRHGFERKNAITWERKSRTSNKAALLAALVTLSGCTNMTASETTFQALNVLDTGQTVEIGRRPYQYSEGESPWAFGRQPTPTRTYAVMTATAIGHYAVTCFIDAYDPGYGDWHYAAVVWQAVGIVVKSEAVGNNFAIGLNPWSK